MTYSDCRADRFRTLVRGHSWNVAERRWLWYCSAIVSLELEVTNCVLTRGDEDGDYGRDGGECGELEIVIEEISRKFVGKSPAISALSNSKSKQWRDDNFLETPVRHHPAP